MREKKVIFLILFFCVPLVSHPASNKYSLHKCMRSGFAFETYLDGKICPVVGKLIISLRDEIISLITFNPTNEDPFSDILPAARYKSLEKILDNSILDN